MPQNQWWAKRTLARQAEALCFPLCGDARSPVPLTKALVKPVCHHLRLPWLQLGVRENPHPDFPVSPGPPLGSVGRPGPRGVQRHLLDAARRAADEGTADTSESYGGPVCFEGTTRPDWKKNRNTSRNTHSWSKPVLRGTRDPFSTIEWGVVCVHTDVCQGIQCGCASGRVQRWSLQGRGTVTIVILLVGSARSSSVGSYAHINYPTEFPTTLFKEVKQSQPRTASTPALLAESLITSPCLRMTANKWVFPRSNDFTHMEADSQPLSQAALAVSVEEIQGWLTGSQVQPAVRRNLKSNLSHLQQAVAGTSENSDEPSCVGLRQNLFGSSEICSHMSELWGDFPCLRGSWPKAVDICWSRRPERQKQRCFMKMLLFSNVAVSADSSRNTSDSTDWVFWIFLVTE